MTFLVNFMFSRIEKFDESIFGKAYIRGMGKGGGGRALIFGMLAVLNIWGGRGV